LANINIKYVQKDKKYFKIIKISILLLLKVYWENSLIIAYKVNITKINIDKYSFLTKINLKQNIYLMDKNILSFDV
jgi:hypothetical protein